MRDQRQNRSRGKDLSGQTRRIAAVARRLLLLCTCFLLPVVFLRLFFRLTAQDRALRIELPALLAALLLHEGGHLLVLHIFDCKRRDPSGNLSFPERRGRIPRGSVAFRPWGVELRKGSVYRSYGEEIAVSLAGVGANLLTAGILFLLHSFGGGVRCSQELLLFFEKLISASLLFALLNLLPIQGLDGGSALEALLLLCTPFDICRVQRLLRFLSILLLIPLWLLSLCVLIASSGNPSFFALCVVLFLELYRKQRG